MSVEMSKDDMLVMLKSGVCRVVFTKVNGEERTMTCTLVRDLIPQEFVPKSALDDTKDEQDSSKPDIMTIRVFDINTRGWRSFRVSTVTSFTYE